MTVGELVYQQMKDGYTPTLPLSDGFISTLNRTAEESQKLVETLRKPFEHMQRTLETMRPHLEAIENMRTIARPALPFMPALYEDADDDVIEMGLNNSVQEYVIDNPAATAKSERPLGSYRLPSNAQWESLEFTFLDGHVVRVSYPGMDSMKFTYTEMGFVNERTMEPDMKWKMLKEIADRGGSLTKDGWDRRFHRNIKYELNEGLKRFFGMTENPIPRYTRRDGYMTLFVIRGDR